MVPPSATPPSNGTPDGRRRWSRQAFAALFGVLGVLVLAALFGTAPHGAIAADTNERILVIDRAVAASVDGGKPATDAAAQPVSLPDDWALTRPGDGGPVWYRTAFDRPPEADIHDLLALYIDRACSNVEVYLNGRRIFGGGRSTEPVTRGCHYPHLITLPTALLQERGNVLDLQVAGHALPRVASRQRAGGLSVLKVGPQALLEAELERRMFWNVTSVQLIGVVLLVLGLVTIALGWLNQREDYLSHFGWLAVAWALMSIRIWWRDLPFPSTTTEFAFCAGFAPVTGLAVKFLMSYAELSWRRIDWALGAQCIVLPATLLIAGPNRLFAMASIWYVVLMVEVFVAIGFYLRATWLRQRDDFWPMVLLLIALAFTALLELGAQHGVLMLPHVQLLQFSAPLMFIGIAVRLLQMFSHALQAAEAGRLSLEVRVREATAEIERNFAQLAELRVEQVTEKERKRIAGDLHDDLGAKLLTIVHMSDSERISTLAREALEEMRLSVRGLTGKPMRLADALADWRAETVLRLGQANIGCDWRGPVDETDQLLPARTFVQTTRILREAVSNIIKHSSASHCKVRCAISDRQFGLTIHDDGKGIPTELDGKLDRGHGMSSMKGRAKQMQGQCLVESAPGFGTVIRLTLPI
jgi:two-component system, NarL family, sensor histidine kinase UhpB